MAYSIKGEYVVTCNCNLICPCAVDGPPTSEDGTCHGGQVLHIAEGSKDGLDLSGIDVGWIYTLPANMTAGNWSMALVFDPSVPDDKVSALEDVFMGKDGGPFAEFAPLIAEFRPTERAKVTFTDGKEPKGSIGSSSLGFTPFLGMDGSPTTLKNAMFAFAPEIELGKGSGKMNQSGISYDAIYGEHAMFEFAS